MMTKRPNWSQEKHNSHNTTLVVRARCLVDICITCYVEVQGRLQGETKMRHKVLENAFDSLPINIGGIMYKSAHFIHNKNHIQV